MEISFSTRSRALNEARGLSGRSAPPQPKTGAATEEDAFRRGCSRRLRARRQNCREVGAAGNRQRTGTAAECRGNRGPAAASCHVTAAGGLYRRALTEPQHRDAATTAEQHRGAAPQPTKSHAAQRSSRRPLRAERSHARRGGATATGGGGRGGAAVVPALVPLPWRREAAKPGPAAQPPPLPGQHALSSRAGPGRRQGHHGEGFGGRAALPQGVPGGLHVYAYRGEGGAGRSVLPARLRAALPARRREREK